MRLAGLMAIFQRPNTSKPAVAHKIYPYLLGIPPAWAALPRTGRTNDTSVFAGGAVRGSVHKFGYGHKQGAAATPHVA
jgi:hypothetical protein